MSARASIRLPRAARPVAAVAALAAMLVAGAVVPAHALKITTWNILNYPNLTLSARQPHFRTVMANLDTDVLVVQELMSSAGRDSFLINVLNVVEPGEWAARPYLINAEGAVFYKPARVSVPFVTDLVMGGPREMLLARVLPVEFTTNAGAFRLYSVHLKAGDGFTDLSTRLTECTNIRKHLNTVTDPFILGGDFNMDSSSELGFVKLTETQTENDGRCIDPVFQLGTWHNNPGFAYFHTQSPCNSGCIGGFSGGGMDDRFDLWLRSEPLGDGEGYDYVPGGYITYGNDGQHYNDNIDGGGFNNAVGLTVATALRFASDHLPVIITLQVPAKLVTDSQLDFGDCIQGGITGAGIFIGNGSTPPADELTFSFAAPAGFGAPAGTQTQLAGLPPTGHEITMDTATPGVKTGTMLVNSDDPDTSSKQVLLSGRVLRHAEPSLDSLVATPDAILQFGAHVPGGFTDMDVRMHNMGYDALQARLSFDEAEITGSARFSIVGGFTPGLVAGTARTLSIHFDDTAAPLDSTYSATLTLRSSDEPLPGAIARPDREVSLYARVVSSPADAPVGGPAAVRFYPPRPNPTTAGTRFAFDLPRAAPVSLDLHDLSGRRVGTLASGTWNAGQHAVTWSGADDSGRRVPAGLYFARFTTPGYSRIERVIVLP